MYKEKKIGVIIAAAGVGRRMGGVIPKQYMSIDEEPIVVKTAKIFCANERIDFVAVAVSSEYKEKCRDLLVDDGGLKIDAIVSGGDTRQDTVYNALCEIKDCGECPDIVLVHDAARPFVQDETIQNVIEGVYISDAAAPAVKPKSTIRTSEGTLDRDLLYMVQTPQGFDFALLWRAYEKAYSDGFVGTDDAGLVERLGHSIVMVEGDYGNIKITTKEDMPPVTRIGNGYDFHALVEGRPLILGGVGIPFEKGLEGHSDADVLIHAVMDALLGAAAMGDIGRHFPDTDEAYRGISSMILLKRVGQMLQNAGYEIGNIDATLIAQKPKIASYIDSMCTNISEALGTEKEKINLKATTTEKMGFIGRGEGMAAEAVCILNK